MSEHRDERVTRARAARSTPTRPAISRCGTSATRRPGSKGNTRLNFGFNYRRWWLQRDLATGFLGNYAYNVGFTGNRGRRHAAWVLLGRRRVPTGGIQRAGSSRQPARVQLQVLRAVLPGRLARQLETDAQPGSPLGLQERALRDQQPHGLAQPGLRARRPVGGRRVPRAGWHRRRRLLPGSGPAQPGESRPLQGVCAASRVCLAADWRQDRLPRRLRPVLRLGGGARDRRRGRRLSVRQPRQLHSVRRPADAAPDVRFAVPQLRGARTGHAGGQHVPCRQPVTAAEEPVHAAVVARRAARDRRRAPRSRSTTSARTAPIC